MFSGCRRLAGGQRERFCADERPRCAELGEFGVLTYRDSSWANASGSATDSRRTVGSL